MPRARGLFHRAVIQSGAVLRVTAPEDATRAAQMLLAELELGTSQVRQLQTIPAERLL